MEHQPSPASSDTLPPVSRNCSSPAVPKVQPSCSPSPPPSVRSGPSTPQPSQGVPLYSAPKILSRNVNGTLVLTSTPTNEAELQLYRVMQRASLLAYYDTLLEMGGDDVQQLCEAGEEEFLEIMALVGMASKPLHVRRLQKALQEWLTNPGMFQTPLVSPGLPSNFLARSLPSFPLSLSSPPTSLVTSLSSPSVTSNVPPSSPPPVESTSSAPSPCQNLSPGQSPSEPGTPSCQLTPVLVESQIAKLAEIAEQLVKALPHLEPKAQNSKKKICKDLEAVFQMSDDDPRRMELIRKYSAIYGRFDCKRKPEKPLTLHEVSVNEAAAQMCKFVPALLTRRDELFPLARQVVRDSGYHYSKGHSKSTAPSFLNGDLTLNNNKRLKLSEDHMNSDEQQQKILRQNRLDQIGDELKSIDCRTEELLGNVHTSREQLSSSLRHQMDSLQLRQNSLLMEQKELIKQHNFQVTRQLTRSSLNHLTSNPCLDSERGDTDDTDSQISFGNVSSPGTSHQEVTQVTESHPERESFHHDSNLERITNKKYGRQIAPLSLSDEENGRGKPPSESIEDTTGCPRESEVLSLTKNHRFRHSSTSPFNYESPYNYDSYFQENRVQVISSSGGNIIAVANPALSMSSLLSSTGMKQTTPISSTGINC
uniref:NGFI-A-binding protein homolog n=2 Tax=Cacopsylla melanoneura TaxID=428564 RepID=A0A8D8XVK9_9HEMI